MHRAWAEGNMYYMLTSSEITAEDRKRDTTKTKEVEQLLNEFRKITLTPNSLPPQGEFDHRIRLIDESKPVNVAPYRYAHFQKDEMKRQVEEILGTRLIRNNTSPFSSPMLLVKKERRVMEILYRLPGVKCSNGERSIPYSYDRRYIK